MSVTKQVAHTVVAPKPWDSELEPLVTELVQFAAPYDREDRGAAEVLYMLCSAPIGMLNRLAAFRADWGHKGIDGLSEAVGARLSH